MAKIQVQQPSGSWMTTASVGDNPQVISKRLDQEAGRQRGRVRAVSDSGSVIDIR